ncbi:hypothetical protein [Deinococcus alpinitundrae]|uniref:hypothetical protein n=1 Tax=Deinococcus alpinitundrae TaxID=468913 RepID=UPI00137B3FF4|nr:hypothetical protein [Deinococcus alpinitundrae]
MLKALPQTYPPVRIEPDVPASGRPAPRAAPMEAESAAPSYLGVALSLLVVPLGLAWATQGAWLSVLTLGVLLLALCAFIFHEDAHEHHETD